MNPGFSRVLVFILAGALLGALVVAQVSDPPKLVMNAIDGIYSDQCQSGGVHGVRVGMTRFDVLESFGMSGSNARSTWYVEDPALGLPPDAIEAPLWPAGRLPDHLMNADQWTVVRAGYARDFEMVISFNDDRVTCADAYYHVPVF